MKIYTIKLLGFILCSFLTLPVIAQSENLRFSPFNVALYVSPVIVGPGQGSYKHMEKSGFNQPGVVIFSNDYPIKSTGARKIEFTYSVKPPFSIKASFFSLNSLVEGSTFTEKWNIKMNLYSPTILGVINIHKNTSKQLFYFGIGPSFNFVKFKSDSFDENSFQNKSNKVGWVVESGMQYPAYSRMFVNLHIRYGYVGKKTEGPFYFQDPFMMIVPNTPKSPDRMVAAFEVPYSNLSLNFGAGIRFNQRPAN